MHRGNQLLCRLAAIETIVAMRGNQLPSVRLIRIAPDRALGGRLAVRQVLGDRGRPALQIFLLSGDRAAQARIRLKAVAGKADRRCQRLLQ